MFSRSASIAASLLSFEYGTGIRVAAPNRVRVDASHSAELGSYLLSESGADRFVAPGHHRPCRGHSNQQSRDRAQRSERAPDAERRLLH
jgi:hypothetical protein